MFGEVEFDDAAREGEVCGAHQPTVTRPLASQPRAQQAAPEMPAVAGAKSVAVANAALSARRVQHPPGGSRQRMVGSAARCNHNLQLHPSTDWRM